MSASTLIQVIAACCGVLGSIFFAIGIMRQSINAMADLASSYFDWNLHMVRALAAQKADYLFGGGIIVLAFLLQLISFLFPPNPAVAPNESRTAVWIAVIATVILFFTLRFGSQKLAARFERDINARLKERLENQLKDKQ
jgi:tetrahydromethanopterin S-methyltransferase subunit C